MKVFITGGTGFIGSAVVSELLESGHRVIALARSEESANKLRTFGSGVDVLYGDLNDHESLKKGVTQSDGVIHLGFIHDFSRFEECCKIDQTAVLCMLESMRGTNKPFVYANGLLWLPEGRLCDEDIRRDPEVQVTRAITEELILGYQDKGVKTMIIRLGASVHGKGDHAFIPSLIEIARSSGNSAYIGDGHNSWPAVHRLDAARLFSIALEHGSAGGVYRAVAESVSTKSIAQAIGTGLTLPLISVPPEEASKQFSFMTMFLSRDVQVSSEKTRTELRWYPREMGLLEDMRANYI